MRRKEQEMTLKRIRIELENHLQITQALLGIATEHGDESGVYFYRGQSKAFDCALSLIDALDESEIVKEGILISEEHMEGDSLQVKNKMTAICYKYFDGDDCINCPLKTGSYEDCGILDLSVKEYYPGHDSDYIAKVKRGEAEWE